MSSPKTIRNPRRLLILSPTSHSTSIIPPLLHSLTGVPVATPAVPATPPAAVPDTDTDTGTDVNSTAQTDPATSSFAGYTTHPPLRIENRYYNAEVPIWVDEVPLDSSSEHSSSPSNNQQQQQSAEPPTPDNDDDDPTQTLTPTQWKTAFSSAEAQVVRDAVGAVVLCVRNCEPDPGADSTARAADGLAGRGDVRALKEFVRAILSVRELIEEERGGVGEVPGVVVLVGRANAPGVARADEDDLVGGGEGEPFSVTWWEDQLYEMGMMGVEVVSWDPREEEGETRNQFGEYQGMRRIREVLETHEWTDIPDETTDTGNTDDDVERHLLGLDEESGFDLEVNELEREMVGLRFAIERGGDEVDDVFSGEGDDELSVDAVEALLSRMKAIKDMSDELPEEERKRFAAKAVRDIMKDI